MDALSELEFPKRVPLRYLVHLPTFLPITVWIVGLSTIASTPDFRLSSLAVWVMVHASTLVLAGLGVLALREILRFAGKSDVGLSWVIATGTLAGLIKASSTAAVELWWGLGGAPLSAVMARGVGAVIVGVWLIAIVAYDLTARERLNDARNALIRSNVAKRLAEDSVAMRPEVDESIRAIDGLRHRLAEDPESVSPRAIREVVDSTIRPLSQALWSVESKRYPTLELVSLYRVALESQRLRPALIALVWSGTTFTGLAVSAGLAAAGAYSVSVGVVALVMFYLVRLGWTQSVVISVFAVVAASSVAVLGGYGLAALLWPGSSEAVGFPLLLAGVAWMSFVTLGSSIIQAAANIRAVIANDLASLRTREMIEQQSGFGADTASSRRIATQLHGTIQSKLLGLAATIERAEMTPTEIDDALVDIQRGLKQFGSDTPESMDSIPTVDHIASSWSGILAIQCDPASQKVLDALLSLQPELVEILRESLTNAFRHGKATAVTIRAGRSSGGEVALEVVDNGYGPRQGEPGLGSALLDQWIGPRWSLVASPEGGSQLRVQIPGDFFEGTTSDISLP